LRRASDFIDDSLKLLGTPAPIIWGFLTKRSMSVLRIGTIINTLYYLPGKAGTLKTSGVSAADSEAARTGQLEFRKSATGPD